MIRILSQVAGVLLCIIGAILALTPIPVGLILFMLGLIILLPTTPSAVKFIRWLRFKVPLFDRFMTSATEKAPEAYRRYLKKTIHRKSSKKAPKQINDQVNK